MLYSPSDPQAYWGHAQGLHNKGSGTVKPNAIVARFHRLLVAGPDGDGAWPPRFPSYFTEVRWLLPKNRGTGRAKPGTQDLG